jgi:RimJ/RimL family protein N-acetyltransferase
MPHLPLPATILRAGGVALRSAAERDIPEILIAYQDDPQLHHRLGQRRPPSGAELGRAAEMADADRLQGRRLELTICEDGADRCVGGVTLHSLDWPAGRGELSLWVAFGLRRRGYGSAALALAAGWLIEYAPLSCLELCIDADNEPMLRTAAAAGARPLPGGGAPAAAGRAQRRWAFTAGFRQGQPGRSREA